MAIRMFVRQGAKGGLASFTRKINHGMRHRVAMHVRSASSAAPNLGGGLASFNLNGPASSDYDLPTFELGEKIESGKVQCRGRIGLPEVSHQTTKITHILQHRRQEIVGTQ